MKLGTEDIADLKLGTSQVNRVYLGGDLVWEKNSFVYFLDLFPGAAAAFAYIKLRSAYSGNCIKIRRDGVSPAELDIGFVDNYLDIAAIATFCGANNGFLTVDYDQSTMGNNKTQTEASKQPKVYDGATGMMLLNGKESKRYEIGSVTNLTTPILIGSSFVLANVETINTVNYIYGTDNFGFSGLIAQGSAGGVNGMTFFNSTSTPTTTSLGNSEDANRKLYIATNSTTNTFMAINGNSLTSFNKTGSIYIDSVGNRQAGAPSFAALNGNIQFEAYYTTDQSDNVSEIQTYLNNYYGIY